MTTAPPSYAHATLLPNRTETLPTRVDAFVEDDMTDERLDRELAAMLRVEALKQEDSFQAREQRAIEFLVAGAGGGSFFSNSPTASLGAENRGWQRGSSKSGNFPEHFQRDRMWEYLWWLYHASDPTFRNIVNAYVVFIRGGGSEIKFTTKEAQDKWRKWSKKNKWPTREREILKATAAFGETFVVMLPKMGTTRTAGSNRAMRRSRSKAEPKIRILNTIDVADVFCSPDDPGEILGYEQKTIDGRPNIVHDEVDVVHFKFDTIPNALRATPMILTALQDLYYYRAFRTNRHWLNMVRSRVPLVITKQKGGAREVAALKAKYSRLPEPGTVWFQNNTTDVKFPLLNVGAADARDDAKLFLRAISQAVNLPEFIVSADASNANYSSTVTAENPAMQMFEDLQALLAEGIARIAARMVGEDEENVTVRFPAVLKNFKELVGGLEKLHKMGVLSNKTACEKAGFDWDGPEGEKARIEDEGGFEPPPMSDPMGGDPPKGEDPNSGGNPPGTGRATPPGSGGG